MSHISVVLFTLFAAVSTDKNDLNNVLFSGGFEFIDLTHPFDNETVYWPGALKFMFVKETVQNNPGSWYAANEFAAGEHGGTHIDAPYHFFQKGQHVGELPLEKLIVPLIVADVSSKVNDNRNFVLRKQDLDYLLNDNMGKPCVIIFKFGWSKYFNNHKKYLGLSDDGKELNFPGLSMEVVEWITSSFKNIVGIGVDVASIDPGNSKDFPAHKLTAASGLYNLENVNLSKNVPEYGCTALVLPMKIAQGTGAPLAV